MHLGTRILQARNQRSISQTELARRAGLAASYLSRIENRKIDPRPKTLRKIADALGVPLAELFREGSAAATLHQCVVTMSGNCIMDSIGSRKDKRRKPKPTAESYTPRQLQLLRMSNYLIQNGNARVLDSLDLLFSSLMASAESRREAKDLVSIAAPSAQVRLRLVGGLRHLKKETARINEGIEKEFETIDPKEWA